MKDSFLMSFKELSSAVGGSLLAGEGKQAPDDKSDDSGQEGFSSVSIDSRAVMPGGLFVAIRGNTLDGHKFVEASFKAGASCAMVAKSALEDSSLDLRFLARKYNAVLVCVDDTLKALQDAARVYLDRFTNLVKIGITGSAGKTTTKEIAAAIIGQEKSVVLNKGNLNSETGLPLSVFEVRSHHEVCVFEAAMNHKGEMVELAKILNPDIALITNIGSAHIGLLGSRDAIAHEKKQLFSQFTGNNTALIPEKDNYRDFLAKDVQGRIVFYGQSSFASLDGVKDFGLEGTEISWEGKTARLGLPGKFNLANAFAAIAIAEELSISAASIRDGIESVKPLFGRGEILYGRSTVIRDCYNSSPESAAQAVDFCDSLEWPGRKVYVIGSMLELGDSSDDAHAALGRQLASCGADLIFLYGEETKAAAYALEGHEAFVLQTGDRKELSSALDKNIQKGDLVLLKGSRGCALEALTEILTGGNTDGL